jgi:hypothetical protein
MHGILQNHVAEFPGSMHHNGDRHDNEVDYMDYYARNSDGTYKAKRSRVQTNHYLQKREELGHPVCCCLSLHQELGI